MPAKNNVIHTILRHKLYYTSESRIKYIKIYGSESGIKYGSESRIKYRKIWDKIWINPGFDNWV